MSVLCRKSEVHKTLVVSGMLSRVGCSDLVYLAALHLLICRLLMASSAQSCQNREKAGTVSKYTNAQHIKNIFVLNYNKAGRGKGSNLASGDVVGASQAGVC